MRLLVGPDAILLMSLGEQMGTHILGETRGRHWEQAGSASQGEKSLQRPCPADSSLPQASITGWQHTLVPHCCPVHGVRHGGPKISRDKLLGRPRGIGDEASLLGTCSRGDMLAERDAGQSQSFLGAWTHTPRGHWLVGKVMATTL